MWRVKCECIDHPSTRSHQGTMYVVFVASSGNGELEGRRSFHLLNFFQMFYPKRTSCENIKYNTSTHIYFVWVVYFAPTSIGPISKHNLVFFRSRFGTPFIHNVSNMMPPKNNLGAPFGIQLYTKWLPKSSKWRQKAQKEHRCSSFWGLLELTFSYIGSDWTVDGFL